MFTQYLQEAFQVPLVIQLTDDEKALWRQVVIMRMPAIHVPQLHSFNHCLKYTNFD